jgi:small-conductance mechanosensitive channel
MQRRHIPLPGWPGIWRGWVLGLLVLVAWAQAGAAEPVPDPAANTSPAVPLAIGTRDIHTFRAPLGAFSAAERAQHARLRIQEAIAQGGEGWTSVRMLEQGVMVDIDGRPMFVVLAADAAQPGQASAEQMANAASRALQTAWREARERTDPRAGLLGAMWVVVALVLLVLALGAVWWLLGWVRETLARKLDADAQAIRDVALLRRVSPIFLSIASRSCVLVAWVLSLLMLFVFVAFSLDQFARTRALGEGLFHAFEGLLLQILSAAASAVPGLFVAVLIFLVAWVCTQVSAELFKQVASGRLKIGLLDAHTAPATRRIVNASLWLFALAMAYPYMPGAQTEAFKGLSVILGIMVSIGASGLIGQIASGVILVYTRALSLGEVVRVQECEGTVTEIGLFVTRLRTGLGVEYALPNAVVLGNVTRNLSRETRGVGYALETNLTIGYDTPWRQVHALLIEAARPIAEIAREPKPYVVQTALSNSYVEYRLVVCVTVRDPAQRALVPSKLHASIQDVFNRHGVQIMSPIYYGDPDKPKVVAEADWYAPPATPPHEPPAPGPAVRKPER